MTKCCYSRSKRQHDVLEICTIVMRCLKQMMHPNSVSMIAVYRLSGGGGGLGTLCVGLLDLVLTGKLGLVLIGHEELLYLLQGPVLGLRQQEEHEYQTQEADTKI